MSYFNLLIFDSNTNTDFNANFNKVQNKSSEMTAEKKQTTDSSKMKQNRKPKSVCSRTLDFDNI